MSRDIDYVTVKGTILDLSNLDAEELRLVNRFKQQAQALNDWNAFDNFWMAEVTSFYEARGLTRAQTVQTIPFRVAQDLSGRIAVKAGLARLPDYRDELAELIRTKFGTRRAFCEATGISESLLSHVLHRRKDLAIDTLEQALARIGYQLHIAPRADRELVEQS
jgi:hypothetical protein